MAVSADTDSRAAVEVSDPLLNKLITGIEFGPGVELKTDSPATAKKIVQEFRRLDVNANGTIEQEDMTEVLQILDPELWTDDRIDRVFRAMDRNHDSAIDFEEFVAWAFKKSDDGDDFRAACNLECLVPRGKEASPTGLRFDTPIQTIPAPKAAAKTDAALSALAVSLAGPRPLLALGSQSDVVFIVDLERERCLRTLHLDGAREGTVVSSLHFSSDGSMLACAADVLYIFDVAKGDCLAKLSNDRKAAVLDCGWLPDSSQVVVAEGAASKIWELDLSRRGAVGGKIGKIHRCDKVHRVFGCCFTEGGGVVSVGAHQGVHVFNEERRGEGKRRSSRGRARSPSPASAPTMLGEHDGHVYRCYLSPCGKMLLTISSDKFPAVWNLENSSLCSRLLGHSDIPTAGAFYRLGADHDNKLLVATAANDHTARVWDPFSHGSCLAVMNAGAPVVGVSFLATRSSWPRLCTLTPFGVQVWELSDELLHPVERKDCSEALDKKADGYVATD